jgi:DNA-binding MarR family transcriptional regulator
LTAPSGRNSGDAADGGLGRLSGGLDCHVGQLCQAAIDGRRAVRTLVQWSERFQLGESEFQILWCLSSVSAPGVDQTSLAARLALSPAQVSACVEKLRVRGLIVHGEVRGDRRRHLWQLSAAGNDTLQKVVQAAGESREAAA